MLEDIPKNINNFVYLPDTPCLLLCCGPILKTFGYSDPSLSCPSDCLQIPSDFATKSAEIIYKYILIKQFRLEFEGLNIFELKSLFQ